MAEEAQLGLNDLLNESDLHCVQRGENGPGLLWIQKEVHFVEDDAEDVGPPK